MPLARPPLHLSPAMKRWWREVLSEYVLETHHLKVLQAACEAWDRGQQAREDVARNGLTINDRWGQPKLNPCVQVERDARTAFLRAVRELDLDVEPPRELPRVAGRR
jgi:P27 family predicted phage terminase small subunit